MKLIPVIGANSACVLCGKDAPFSCDRCDLLRFCSKACLFQSGHNCARVFRDLSPPYIWDPPGVETAEVYDVKDMLAGPDQPLDPPEEYGLCYLWEDNVVTIKGEVKVCAPLLPPMLKTLIQEGLKSKRLTWEFMIDHNMLSDLLSSTTPLEYACDVVDEIIKQEIKENPKAKLEIIREHWWRVRVLDIGGIEFDIELCRTLRELEYDLPFTYDGHDSEFLRIFSHMRRERLGWCTCYFCACIPFKKEIEKDNWERVRLAERKKGRYIVPWGLKESSDKREKENIERRKQGLPDLVLEDHSKRITKPINATPAQVKACMKIIHNANKVEKRAIFNEEIGEIVDILLNEKQVDPLPKKPPTKVQMMIKDFTSKRNKNKDTIIKKSTTTNQSTSSNMTRTTHDTASESIMKLPGNKRPSIDIVTHTDDMIVDDGVEDNESVRAYSRPKRSVTKKVKSYIVDDSSSNDEDEDEGNQKPLSSQSSDNTTHATDNKRKKSSRSNTKNRKGYDQDDSDDDVDSDDDASLWSTAEDDNNGQNSDEDLDVDDDDDDDDDDDFTISDSDDEVSNNQKKSTTNKKPKGTNTSRSASSRKLLPKPKVVYPSHGWGLNFAALVDYGQKHGTCNIPQRDSYDCILPGMGDNGEEYYYEGRLGGWLSNQRRDKKAGKLSSEKQAKLQQLVDQGLFTWDASDNNVTKKMKEQGEKDWPRHYAALIDYGQKHGTCNISAIKSYECILPGMGDDGEEYHYTGKLGMWLANQRTFKKKGKLSSERQALLQLLVSQDMLYWTSR